MRKSWIALAVAGGVATVLQATPASAGEPFGTPTQNWAGYAVSVNNKTMGAATGTFTVPKISCTDRGSVGWFAVTGGVRGPSEAGAGVGASCDATSGTPVATYWLYALWHGTSIQGPVVKAGHVIKAQVVVTGNKYVLTANDTTSNVHHTWTKTCSTNCEHSTAGWVTAIGPGNASTNNSLVTLAAFKDPKWRALTAKVTGAKSAFAPLHYVPIEPLWIENEAQAPLAYVGDMTAKATFPTIYASA